MLPKQHRLTKDKEFEKVFKTGRSSYDKIIGFKIVPNEEQENRFGILVGTKISKKAIIRNKIKRRIRQVIQSRIPFMKKSYDCVVIALPPILNKSYNEIEDSINYHLKKLKLLC